MTPEQEKLLREWAEAVPQSAGLYPSSIPALVQVLAQVVLELAAHPALSVPSLFDDTQPISTTDATLIGITATDGPTLSFGQTLSFDPDPFEDTPAMRHRPPDNSGTIDVGALSNRDLHRLHDCLEQIARLDRARAKKPWTRPEVRELLRKEYDRARQPSLLDQLIECADERLQTMVKSQAHYSPVYARALVLDLLSVLDTEEVALNMGVQKGSRYWFRCIIQAIRRGE